MTCHCHSMSEHASRAVAAEVQHSDYKLQAALDRIKSLESEIASLTPDDSNYEILDAQEVGCNLVVKVQYTGCKCSYQGVKVMVFLKAKAIDALKWKRLDPHFREAVVKEQQSRDGSFHQIQDSASPSPAARFPATDEGRKDAIAYAATKG